jgi:hypothetical protein
MTDLADPDSRLGVFKRFEDVPGDRRLGNFEATYRDRDVFTEWAESTGQFDYAERKVDNVKRTWRFWCEHMAEQGRHPVCPDPEHVETFFRRLFDGEFGRNTWSSSRTPCTVYLEYYTVLNDFFQWLVYRTDHEHTYNPVGMAMATYRDGASGEVWAERMNQRDRGT